MRERVTIILRQDLLDTYPFKLLRYLYWFDVIDFTTVSTTARSWLSAIEPNGNKKVAFKALYCWLSLIPLTSFFSIILHPDIMQNFQVTKQSSTS